MRKRGAVIALVCALCGLTLAVQAPSRNTVEGTKIFVVNADGSGRRNLTAGMHPATRIARALSPDGRLLAFDRLRGAGTWSIDVMPARGGKARTLIRLPDSVDHPAWSRDGKLVAFRSCCGVGIVKRDGSGLVFLREAVDPVWVRGERLAFVAGDTRSELVMAKPDGSERTSIVWAEAWGLESLVVLTASPDGGTISLSATPRYRDGRGLYSISAAAEAYPRRVSKRASDPSWSPTSLRLVFVTDRGLVTADPEGTRRRRYRATQSLNPGVPSWSPDGTRIAFVANISASLMVLNVRHGSLRLVARGVEGNRPLWSPNGRRLYYTALNGS